MHASITWLTGTAGTAQKSSVQSPQIKVNFLGLQGGPRAGAVLKWSYVKPRKTTINGQHLFEIMGNIELNPLEELKWSYEYEDIFFEIHDLINR